MACKGTTGAVMSDMLEDLFEYVPKAPCGIKRTYSRRHDTQASIDDLGLPTPPNSSSPPTSPMLDRTLAMTSLAAKKARIAEPTARSITAILERSNNVPSKRPRYRKSSLQKDKKELVQMHLNLLPAHMTCKECGMSYTRTSGSDAALHTVFHSSHLQGLPLSSTLTLVNGVHRLSYNKTSERNMMMKCVELVDRELSASLTPLDSSFVGFIMVEDGRIKSFVLVQSISRARVLDRVNGEEGEETAAVMGISRMWTSRRSRGHGKVRDLLDRARREFVPGCMLDKSEVAFTQLSESGLRAIEKWQLSGPILIYCD